MRPGPTVLVDVPEQVQPRRHRVDARAQVDAAGPRSRPRAVAEARGRPVRDQQIEARGDVRPAIGQWLPAR